ncbi:glycosyltransferase [Paenibacillus ihbetae]|uniref:Glycosyltransferase 2-like domain-containing protein n=1 Tax=Paenibacillus ihbetae TaxID=1870820 RepID=A0ABX3K2N1_9BACL|nr:glycosyltransferase [Paenibacillus ihbetae]OOC63686.1 hypothetical protein BBD40_18620 [Paenibacillus ihbetae]
MDNNQAELQKKLLDLEKELEKYKIEVGNQKIINEELNNSINRIYESNGWKFLSRYYKFRDKLKLKGFSIRKKIKKNPLINSEIHEEIDLVTIIIPVYNNLRFLKKCIDSALSQTYENLEVIAYDDCSTDDGVLNLLNNYTSNPRFRFFQNDVNLGISTTMNNAIIRAKGKWIAFLDCDDWLETTAIEKLMLAIKSTPDSVYGYSDRYNEYEQSGETRIETFINRPRVNMFEELLKGMYVSHLKIIKREVFLKIGLHETRFNGAQDYDIALKTAFHFGDSFAYLPEAVYHHRIHDKQTTIEASEKIDSVVKIIKMEAQKRKMIREGDYNRKVSFVILSFEKKEMTLKCVESIKKTVRIPHEIIIFDNASSAETVSFLKNEVEKISNVSIYYSPENLGCPGGRRHATQLANGDYIINLDNDIIVTEDWLEELIIRAEHNDDVGAVCCKTVFPNGKIQFNGGSYVAEDDFITFLLTHNDLNEDDLQTALWLECMWVPGGATLFKKSLVKKLDYSNDYINAFEDNDVALQVNKLGYRMFNCPTAKVYHYHFMFDEAPSKEQRYMEVRYKEESFIKSLINFYKRNNLIINDQFVFRLLGLEGKPHKEIRSKVQQLQEELFPLIK